MGVIIVWCGKNVGYLRDREETNYSKITVCNTRTHSKEEIFNEWAKTPFSDLRSAFL